MTVRCISQTEFSLKAHVLIHREVIQCPESTKKDFFCLTLSAMLLWTGCFISFLLTETYLGFFSILAPARQSTAVIFKRDSELKQEEIAPGSVSQTLTESAAWQYIFPCSHTTSKQDSTTLERVTPGDKVPLTQQRVESFPPRSEKEVSHCRAAEIGRFDFV